MEVSLVWIICYLCLGGVVGFMAGLLGIGGGGIMVPILTSLFLLQGVPVDNVVHLALGTSMAAIIITSISSMRAHHKRGMVQWNIVRQISPGIAVGAFSATFLIVYLNSVAASLFFAIFMAYVSVQMFLDIKPKPTRTLPSRLWVSSAGVVIGAISSMVSIAGGSLSVPYMSWHNIDMKKAISTSAAIGVPIAIVGSIGFMVNGFEVSIDLPYTVGFINVLAVFCVSIVSYFLAPVGAGFAHRLPTKILKKIFAVLLLCLSLKMLISVALM